LSRSTLAAGIADLVGVSQDIHWQIVSEVFMNTTRSTVVFLIMLSMTLLPATHSDAQSSFYQNKTMQVVVGSASGGLYDRWARLFAQHMGKYIPGNPNLVVQSMPGGGSMIAANYPFGVAKPDGLTIGMF
jgi:tripartite-type tricarboxylate transporter receptor subunit TctC